jgi:hypothetical protein
MKKINNELALSSIISKQNTPVNIISQEKFSNFLENENNEEEDISNDKIHEVNIVMQSLQNKAQLNRMIIESVA